MTQSKKYESVDLGLVKLKADVIKYEDGSEEIIKVYIELGHHIYITIDHNTLSEQAWLDIWSRLGVIITKPTRG